MSLDDVTSYSVGGSWMNDYGAMVEWYWQGKTEVLGEKYYTALVVDEWVSMEQWRNDTERKILYSVGGRRMSEYGAMEECYWQGKTEVLGEKHYTAWVVGGWVSMEQWWNDTDRGKLKYWEKIIYTALVVDGWVSMEQWWNDTDRGKLNYWEKNIIQRGW